MLNDIVKKDGKLTLEPKVKEADTFETRIKGNRLFFFRLKLEDLEQSLITVKFDLKSIDEINMEIKEKSKLLDEDVPVKHLEIAYLISMSTLNEKPCEF